MFDFYQATINKQLVTTINQTTIKHQPGIQPGINTIPSFPIYQPGIQGSINKTVEMDQRDDRTQESVITHRGSYRDDYGDPGVQQEDPDISGW